MKKKLVLLLLAIVCLFGASSDVEALGNAENFSGGTNECNKSDVCIQILGGFQFDADKGIYTNYKWAVQGYRVTVYKKDANSDPVRARDAGGTFAVRSVDYILQYDKLKQELNNTDIYYTTYTYRSKIDYVSGVTLTNKISIFAKNNIFEEAYKVKDLISGENPYIRNGYDILGDGNYRLPWAVGVASTDPPRIDARNGGTGEGNILRDWFLQSANSESYNSIYSFYKGETNTRKGLLDQDGKAIKAIIESGGFKIDNNDLSNYYLVIEPIALLKAYGIYYLGTAYELSYLVNVKNASYKEIEYLRNQLPYSIYLSFDISDTSGNNFFGGNGYLSVEQSTSSGFVLERNGMGIGVFWLKDITKSSCDYNNPDHFKTTSSGPNGENCCEGFNTDDYPNLVEDYPICGSCPATTRISIIDTDTKTEASNGEAGEVPPSVYDYSNRCSMSGGDAKISVDGKNTDYIVEDYLKNGIENNTCLPITSRASDDNSSGYNLIEKKLNQYCTVKCLETNSFNIPSNPKVTVSTYHFVWPTSPSTAGLFGNDYPLNASNTTTCRIVVKAAVLNANFSGENARNGYLGLCATQLSKVVNDLTTDSSKFNPEIKLYQKNNKTNREEEIGALQSYNEKTTCSISSSDTDCNKISTELANRVNSATTSADKVKALRSFRFTVTETKGYKLDSTINSYYEKSTGVSTSTKNNGKQYVLTGYGNIPINVMSTTSSYTYNETMSASGSLILKINNVSKHFSFVNEMSCAVDYYAKYDDLYSKTNPNYFCKVGTKSAGKNVNSCVGDDGILNNQCVIQACSEEGKHYCSATTIKKGSLIDNTEWDKKYQEYRTSNSTEKATELTQSYFDNGYCSEGEPTNYYCPVESNYPNKNITFCVKTMFMDINGDGVVNGRDQTMLQKIIAGTESVTVERLNAGDLNQDGVIDKLDLDLYVNYRVGTININSVNEAITYCQAKECNGETKKQIFIYRSIDLNNPFPSITGLGRLPGTNWNYIDKSNNQARVNSYITNNRGVTTNEVYKKTPLYTFKLNAGTIAKIKEYNKGSSYDDFNLSCNGNGRECISSFVHNTRYGFVDNSSYSACNSKNKFDFYKCLK